MLIDAPCAVENIQRFAYHRLPSSQNQCPDGADIAKIVHSTGGALARVYTEIEKLRRMQA